MNFIDELLWGFIATLSLSTIMAASVGLGLSRMSLPLMLGTMLTPDRNRAPLLGFLLHLAIGWIFTLPYALIFERTGHAGWWFGSLLGLAHACVVLVVLLPLLPGLHPRMASENQGPEPTRALEPPGFLGLNYGRRTPLVAALGHIVYGALLGGFYRLTGS